MVAGGFLEDFGEVRVERIKDERRPRIIVCVGIGDRYGV